MNRNNNWVWFTSGRVALIALVLNILIVVYSGLISNNDIKNLVKQHEIRLEKVDKKLEVLQNDKLDKQTFQMMYLDLKQDLSDIKADLRDKKSK